MAGRLTGIGHLYSQKRPWSVKKRYRLCFLLRDFGLTYKIVNEILGDHNVDKQMTDSRGDVGARVF